MDHGRKEMDISGMTRRTAIHHLRNARILDALDRVAGRKAASGPATPGPGKPSSPPSGKSMSGREVADGWIKNRKGDGITRKGLLPTDKVPGAHSMNRLVTPEESLDTMNRWVDAYDETMGGGPLASASGKERTGTGRSTSGRTIPRVYSGGPDGMTWTNPAGKQRPYLLPRPAAESVGKDFTALANRIRPGNFSIHEPEGGDVDRAYAKPQGGAGGGGMFLGRKGNLQDGPTGVHELEHTMQHFGPLWDEFEDTDEWWNRRSGAMETPAVLAEAAAEARAGARAAKNPGSAEIPDMSARYSLGRGEDGIQHGGLSAHTMARQASRHMWGENPDTGKRTAPARTMTDLLSTPEGKAYLRLLNREVPKTEAQKAWEAEEAHALSRMRQGSLESAYRAGENRRDGFTSWTGTGEFSGDMFEREADDLGDRLRAAAGRRKKSSLGTTGTVAALGAILGAGGGAGLAMLPRGPEERRKRPGKATTIGRGIVGATMGAAAGGAVGAAAGHWLHGRRMDEWGDAYVKEIWENHERQMREIENQDPKERMKEIMEEIRARKEGAVTWVPRSSLDSVRRHGLLGSRAMLDNPEALGEMAAARGTTPGDLRREIRKALGSWRGRSLEGPNILFKAPPKGFEVPDNHPTKETDMVQVRVRLRELLKEVPGTVLHGQELVPYSKEDSERLGDSYADMRHRDLSAEEVEELAGRSARDLWKGFEDLDGKGLYAPNVPHAAVITPDGRIDPRYLRIAGA